MTTMVIAIRTVAPTATYTIARAAMTVVSVVVVSSVPVISRDKKMSKHDATQARYSNCYYCRNQCIATLWLQNKIIIGWWLEPGLTMTQTLGRTESCIMCCTIIITIVTIITICFAYPHCIKIHWNQEDTNIGSCLPVSGMWLHSDRDSCHSLHTLNGKLAIKQLEYTNSQGLSLFQIILMYRDILVFKVLVKQVQTMTPITILLFCRQVYALEVHGKFLQLNQLSIMQAFIVYAVLRQ